MQFGEKRSQYAHAAGGMPLKQVLRRFEMYVYRDLDAGSGDKRQVPAAARIEFYVQGATVTIAADETLSPTQEFTFDVWNTGAIDPEDDVLVGPGGPSLHVVKVELMDGSDPVHRIKLKNNGTENVTVKSGDRLLRVNNRPLAQIDPTGAATSGNPYVDTDPVTGRAFCYLRPFRFDAVVTGSELTTKLFQDSVGSFVMRT